MRIANVTEPFEARAWMRGSPFSTTAILETPRIRDGSSNAFNSRTPVDATISRDGSAVVTTASTDPGASARLQADLGKLTSDRKGTGIKRTADFAPA